MTQVKIINSTDSNSSVTFNPVVNLVKIKNTGSNFCYFNINAAATTSLFRLDPGEEIEIGLYSITTVQAICDTGLTSTLRIVGSDEW